MNSLILPDIGLLLLHLLLLSPSLSHAISSAKQQSFLHCLNNHIHPNNLIFTPDNKNYMTLLFSSIQNHRTISNSPKPLAIITPTQESHVQASVSCSQEHNIPLRIRSGGHDYEGLSYASTISPSFIIIDLQRLSSITIDATVSTAWVQAGATLGELYYAIAMKSRVAAFPAGTCPTVGVGGHLSGGGVGTLMRSYGLSIDNIIDARIVTARGDILDRKSMGEDLFWALRGGGGASFGVILAYEINLVQVPPKVTVFAKRKTKEEGVARLVDKWQQIAHKLDRRIFFQAILTLENGNSMNVKATFNSLFLGEKEELLILLGESFPDFKLNADDCIEMSWIESVLYFAGYSSDAPLSVLLDRKPVSNNSSFKNKADLMTTPIGEEGWNKIFRWLAKENKWPMVIINPFGGRMDEISENETPFPHRKGSLCDVQYIKGWTEEGEEETKMHLDWMKRLYEFMTPYVSRNPRAAYLNYRDLDLGKNEGGDTSYAKARVWGSKYFKDKNFRRLAKVKTRVDPGNYFRNEQSIPLFSKKGR